MIYNAHYKVSVNAIRVRSALVGGHLSTLSVVPGRWHMVVLVLNPNEEVLRAKKNVLSVL